MPTKPPKEVINASKSELDAKQLVLTIINEDPILREQALEEGLVREVRPKEA